MDDNRFSGRVILLILGWIIFAILTTVFFMFFFDDLPFKTKEVNGEISDKNNQVTTSYIYDTNKNLDINVLVSSYLDALVNCRQEELKSYALNPAAFDNMAPYEEKAKFVEAYENINCYTVKGFDENSTIVYVISNVKIKDVVSKPLDIQTLYIKIVDGKYYIDNNDKDEATIQYIADKTGHSDIQDLYKAVQENINYCLDIDETFKNFYDSVNIQ